MIVSFIRTLILYVAIVAALRLMGKKQIGELQPSELVVAISIADLACIPMQTTDIPLINGIIPIITLVIAEISLSFLSLKSRRFRRILTGRPNVLIRNGKIQQKEMERLRLNLDDLMEALRTSNCPDIRDVDFAVLETNGQLNVVMKADKRPVTPADLGIKPLQDVVPHPVISDGKLIVENMERLGITEKWLKNNGIKRIEDIFYAAVDNKNRLFFQKKER